jgi:hypothetical protein
VATSASEAALVSALDWLQQKMLLN